MVTPKHFDLYSRAIGGFAPSFRLRSVSSRHQFLIYVIYLNAARRLPLYRNGQRQDELPPERCAKQPLKKLVLFFK